MVRVKALSKAVCLGCLLIASAPGLALVNLEWRPLAQSVPVGGRARLSLYACSSGADELISAVDALILVDPRYLALERQDRGSVPYPWLADGFFSPSPDGVNNSLTDGVMLYTALGRPGMAPVVDAQGMLVMTFEFTVLDGPATTTVTTPINYGPTAQTHVYDARRTNHDIHGAGSSATVSIVPAAEAVSSVAAAQGKPDGSVVQIQIGPFVSRAFATEGFFYVQDPGRAAGLRVNSSSIGQLLPGQQLAVTGVLATVNGERVLDSAQVSMGPPGQPPRPLIMNAVTAEAPVGLAPRGLLVTVSGRVTHLEPGGSLAYLSDGSPQDLRVVLHGAQPPAKGALISVTGPVGADADGPLLHVASDTDLAVLSQ